MNPKLLKLAFWMTATLGVANLGLGAAPMRKPSMISAYDLANMPTPEQAVKYAQSVVLVKRVIQDNQIYSYVKEVWRSGADATPPPVGSEYGRPTPYESQMRFPERDAIVFEFGTDPSKGLPNTMRIPVTEKRRVPTFPEEVPVLNDDGTVRRMTEEPMHVDDVRSRVKKTKPGKPHPSPESTSGGMAPR